MKKVLSNLLMVLLVFFALSSINLSTSAATATSGTTGDCTWSLDGTVLTISGNGDMGSYNSGKAPWGTYVTEVVIRFGVRNIGGNAFCDCSNLKSITIPDSVSCIEYSAFDSCGITSIIIPAGVTIEESAFYYCRDLTSVIIKGSLIIPSYAFAGCNKLSSIIIGSGVKYIDRHAFSGCTSLKSII